jgi:plastocyanin
MFMKNKILAIGLLFLALNFNAAAKQIRVDVLNVEFSPKNFTATVGDTIHFVWVAGFHTTTSTSVPAGALTWDEDINSTATSFLYVLKVSGNYAYQCSFHVAMGMIGSFTVVPVAKIITVKTVSVNNCTNTNSIQYKCTKSKPPYKVQLFRYGKSFGSARTVADTLPFTFSSLPIGSYFARATGNGGTDSLSGKSGTSVLMPVPSGLKALHITSSKSTLKWTGYTCVKFYTVQYRKKGTSTWTKINTIGNKDSINLTSLTSNTKYQFQVASADSANKIIATGKFSAIDSFMTAVTGTLEAENAFLSGAVVASSQPGFTGTGYADYVHASGDYIEWTLNTTIAGSFSLKFRYANGGTTNRPLQLKVNGTIIVASLAFNPTGSWATWSVSSATANLIAGANKIRLTTIGSNGPNVDNLNYTGGSVALQRSAVDEDVLPSSPAPLEASVSPNPATEITKLVFSAASDLPVSLELIDITGRRYKTIKVSKMSSKTIDIQVSDLPSGNYIILIKQGNQSTYTRLIVQRK